MLKNAKGNGILLFHKNRKIVFIMNEYKKVELYPVDSLRASIGDNLKYSEMVAFDHSFLCGLLKEKKPSKILEIGVAAGVTTAIILGCEEEIKSTTILYSLDISEKWYRNPSKQTGFVAEEWKENNNYNSKHIRLFGIISDHIEKICQDGKLIDFLVLDTMHLLPGEILDYMICAPFLSEDAIIVLHDVGLMHVINIDSNAYATRLLFDLINAEKYYMKDNRNVEGISNIAAFKISNTVKEGALEVFKGLYYTWQYIPDNIQLRSYRKIIKRLYGKEISDEFASIIGLQKHTSNAINVSRHWGGSFSMLMDKCKSFKNIYIYGCGEWGKQYYEFFNLNNISITGMLVSDNKDITFEMIEQFGKVSINHLSEIKGRTDINIVLAVGSESWNECCLELKKIGLYRYLIIPF